VFIIGIAVFLWGVFAIAISAGFVHLSQLSMVSFQTPIGTVQTDDKQYGGGLLLAVLGLVAVGVSPRL
jgi:hypothetical protein